MQCGRHVNNNCFEAVFEFQIIMAYGSISILATSFSITLLYV